eukprot:PhM_4_TR4793/c0_g1_i1/m.47729/K10798/PARP; poly [ADP-ribose] polymerase
MADDDEKTSFKAEYAASGRSKCFSCRQPISEGALRLGPLVNSPKGDFKYPQWNHYTCFVDAWLPRHPGKLVNVADVAGLDKVKFEDAKKIRALVPGALESADVADAKVELAMAKQNDKVWAMRTKLEALENKELQELLEHNGQPNKGKIFGGRNNMLDRAADGMVFGALPKCGVCPDGDLRITHGQYVCTGAVDEFTRCTNVLKEDDVERDAWEVPEDLRSDYTFLRTYRSGKKPRVQKVDASVVLHTKQQTNPNPSQAQSQPAKRDRDDDDGEEAAEASQATGPLRGVTVGSAGRLSKAVKAIEAEVGQNGGVYDKGHHVTVMLSTANDTAAMKVKKLKDAVDAGVLVVSEDWLAASISAGKPLLGDDATAYCLVKAKEDKAREARKRVAERNLAVNDAQDQRRELDKEEMMREEYRDKPQVKSGGTKKLVIKGSAAVDPDCEIAETAHVYECASGGKNVVYSQTMSRTDVTTNKNSYYILQLLEDDKGTKKKYHVFRKWGRLGHDDIGGTKLTDYPNISGAMKEFEKMYLDKTGNAWANRDNFKKFYDKFQPLDIDYGKESGGGVEDTSRKEATYNGTLPAPTQSLIKLLFDMKAMTSALQEMKIDTQKMPLGKLSSKTIQEGFQCIAELQKVLDEIGDDGTPTPAQTARITSQTNKFYTFIPHIMSDPATMLLDSAAKIKEKSDLLGSLREMEIATTMMKSMEGNLAQGEHPIDVQYKKLKTDLRWVPRDDPVFKTINAYLLNTHAPTHTTYTLELQDLWEISRHGEDEIYKPWKDYDNRALLWHGSRLTNWVGILSQGLRIAPPEAPKTGYMFGKGVYFADMSSKSANYCFTTSEATTGMMLLSEVALGNMKRYKSAFFVDGLEKKYQSTMGEGKIAPDPAATETMPNGCTVPLGKPVETKVPNTTLQYNEFIVYDTSQIQMKYLLRLNFKYKTKCGTFF